MEWQDQRSDGLVTFATTRDGRRCLRFTHAFIHILMLGLMFVDSDKNEALVLCYDKSWLQTRTESTQNV